MEFLQLIETMRAEHASLDRLLNEDGAITPATIRKRRNYAQLLHEALSVLQAARRSSLGKIHFAEAMKTSDFPLLMGDVLDRQVYATYMETPQTWSSYCKRSIVPDFRDVKRFAVDGAEGRLPSVGEKVPYSPNVLSEARYSYAVTKYGRTLNWSWESFINDDLDALGSSSPARLGKAARRSEDYFATGLHVDSSGPHASLYTSGNANIINTTNGAASTNPALGIAGLQDAFTVMGLQLDGDSEPIGIDGVILEVPASLEVTARNVLNATEIKVGADSGAQQILTSNWMKSKVTLVVNPYISVIATTNGRTSWFVHANPNSGRPAMEFGLLRGHEAPELFMKLQNQVKVGGGGSGFDGSFEDDVIAYKVRHCFGGSRISGKSTVGSNGSGS